MEKSSESVWSPVGIVFERTLCLPVDSAMNLQKCIPLARLQALKFTEMKTSGTEFIKNYRKIIGNNLIPIL